MPAIWIEDPALPSLLIRNVDAALHARLKEHAETHRRSLEDEERELLRVAVAEQVAAAGENIVDIARRLLGPTHGVELTIPQRGRAPRREPPDFFRPEFGR